MGDILHALPAVTALRLAHPAWVIDWVVEPRWRALLAAEDNTGSDHGRSAAQPLVDHVHLASTKTWRKAPFSRQTFHEFMALRSALRAGEYDAVIDLQGAIRSAWWRGWLAAGVLIGEAEPRELAARWLFKERVATHGAHVIEQDVELASAIAGDSLMPVEPWLPVDPAAEAWADEILPPITHKTAVLINPGAGWGAKRWPVERYAAVAKGAHRTRLPRAGQRWPRRGAAGRGHLPLYRRRGHSAGLHTGPTHRHHPPHCPGCCRRHRPAAPGLRTWPAGRGHLWPHRPQPQRAVWYARFTVLRSPESRRDHSRYEAPEAGLLTIQPEDVMRAADALLYPESAPMIQSGL
jgi:heptosyltransferase-1